MVVLQHVLLVAWTTPSLLAAVANCTIDDSFGDSQTGMKVTYLPAGVWQDQTCSNCSLKPDLSNVFNETYTAAMYNPSLGSMNITMQFNGTAIYVYFILVNSVDISTITLADFSLDGNTPTHFTHLTSSTIEFEYNQLVFQQADLLNTQHTLVISTSGIFDAYMNFDYVIYTHVHDVGDDTSQINRGTFTTAPPEPSVTPPKTIYTTVYSAPIGASANGNPTLSTAIVVGSVIAAICLILSLGFCIRRRFAKRSNENTDRGRSQSLNPGMEQTQPTIATSRCRLSEPTISINLDGTPTKPVTKNRRDLQIVQDGARKQLSTPPEDQLPTILLESHVMFQVQRLSDDPPPEYASGGLFL